ncbi:MAG: DUF5666 domain-containing protein [Gammaproteobacteria bacterium]
MKRALTSLYSVLALIALLLPGCDTGGVVAGIDRGGVTGGSVGTITGFGSVIVNGVHYDTANANIMVNGISASESDLEVGYFVAVESDVPADGMIRAATSIEFDHDLMGSIQAVDVTQQQVFVLGQAIAVDDRTIFGPGIEPPSADGLAALPPRQAIRISGLPGVPGTLLATRIDLGAPGAAMEITGIVSSTDSGASTLQIGGLTVEYLGANLDGFDGNGPSVGDRVKAEGEQSGAGGVLLARSLKRKKIKLSLGESDELEVEGLVDEFVSASSFSVSGIPVGTGAKTTYKNGVPEMLGPGVRVEVAGRIDVGGLLVADEIDFRRGGELRIQATAEFVNASEGALELLGLTILTDRTTSFEDKSAAELRPFSLPDINPGDPLRIRAAAIAGDGGALVATQISRTEPLERVVIRGTASNLAAPQLSVLGVTVLTDAGTEMAADFFARADGRLVEVQGNITTGSFLAEKIEIKD